MSSTLPSSLRELLAARVARTPDALLYSEAGRTVSAQDLDRSSREIAAGLQGNGVVPGDRLAIVMSAGIAFAEVFWAAQRIGAIPCALNPTVPSETIARRAARIGPRLVIDDERARTMARPGATPDEADAGPGGLAHLQTTSGTGGEPRTAMVGQDNVLAYLRASHEAYAITEDDVLVSWVPPWHDLGLVHYVVRPVHAGLPCHMVEPSVRTIPEWFRTIATVRGTLSGAPDFALRLATRLVDPEDVDLGSLRSFTNGGEPVRSSTIAAFEERFSRPGVVVPGYGLAEATLGVATRPLTEPLRVDGRGNVSCGVPLPGVEVRAGASVDRPEEILVRGATVFAGYLDDEEATREALRDGWLHTGDEGYLDGDGQLYVLGRRRALINRGGAVLAPRELEEAALAHPDVRKAAAVGIPSREGASEEIVVVVETAAPERAEAIARAVSSAIRRSLGFAPERVVVLPPRSIPITPNGKVRHARLAEVLPAVAPSP